METKYIPENLSIHNNRLVSEKEEKSCQKEELTVFKNVPVSGIIITKLDSWGCAQIHDPRGFNCSVVNLNELLDKIDIERGVISQDLRYGRMPRSTAWRLYTPELIKKEEVKLTSVSELKPGWLYNMPGTRGVPVLYLGKLKWKDEYYGTLRPHHTFANPETRTIIPAYYLTAPGISSLEIDDPGLYKEALDVFKSSWFGNKDIKVVEIALRSGIKYRKYNESFLMPELNKDGWYSSRDTLFMKQTDSQTIEVMTVTGQYRREPVRYGEEARYVKCIIIKRFVISVDEKYLPAVKVKVGDHNYEYGVEKLNDILKDPAWKCVDTTDPDTIKNYLGGYRNYYGLSDTSGVDFYDCILNNEERIVQSDLKYHHLKF